jgi:uncharacterized membrane protein
MSKRGKQSLGHRAEHSGILFAAANVPLTFQRTLMPRNTMDQAIVTGLSVSTNQALVTMLQEAIQASALIVLRRRFGRKVSDKTWSRAAIAADAAAIGAGILVQRQFKRHDREPLRRAAIRTGGFWLSIAGLAGGIAGGLEEALGDGLDRRHRLLALAPVGAILATGVEGARRRRERLDVGLPEEEAKAAVAKSLLFGIGITAATSGLATLERASANKIASTAERLIPGADPAIVRPLGHAISLGAFVLAARYAAQNVLGKIESKQEAVETAFDVRPPSPFVSGSEESCVPFETLAVSGRRYAWMTSSPALIHAVTGESGAQQPIRVYSGLASAPTEVERVDLALRDLERTGAFEREWLMVVSPTGTGYVNYAAVSALEFLSRGNCATVAMQYSARPSVLSLRRVAEGRQHMHMLLAGIRAKIAEHPVGRRPKVILFGESLGAWTSQDPFVDQGTRGLVDAGIDHAIWIGTPHMSKWKEQVLFDEGAHIDRSLVGVYDNIDEWNAQDDATKERVRFVMITHTNDGVALFGPELAIQSPEWLGKPAERPRRVPKAMRWMPSTTFFQVLTDMKNSANVVPGVFAATGHDYRADLLPFFHATLGFKDSPEQLAAIDTWLQNRERQRSEWIRSHGHAGSSLSAAFVEQWRAAEREAGRDPDAELIVFMRGLFAADSPPESPSV